MNRDPKKRTSEYKPEDFHPFEDVTIAEGDEIPEITPEQLADIF